MFGILKFSKLDDKYEQYYKKHFFDEYCYNYVKFEGIVFREYFEIIANQIQKIDIKEDGVFVCSFLKSGIIFYYYYFKHKVKFFNSNIV